MSLRGRLKRAEAESLGTGGIKIRQRDGTVRAFSEPQVWRNRFLARSSLLRGEPRSDLALYSALYGATASSRQEFEERYDSVTPSICIVSKDGWAELRTLSEDNSIEKERHEPGSAEADALRAQAVEQGGKGASLL